MKACFVVLVISLFLATSCNEDSPSTCGVEEPAKDLDWLAAGIDVMEKSGMSQFHYVTKAKYGFMTVFIFGNCCPTCNSVLTVYNCSGDHIGNIGNGEGDVSPSILDNDVVIWKPDNSACVFQ